MPFLQLKGEGGGGLVTGSGQDQILMTVDSKFGIQQDRMVPSQVNSIKGTHPSIVNFIHSFLYICKRHLFIRPFYLIAICLNLRLSKPLSGR